LRQIFTDFLNGFLGSMAKGLGEAFKNSGIDTSIEEHLEKFRKKLFVTGIAISIIASGFFLILWGIGSAIDKTFAMRGLGFVLIGLLGALTGALIYKK
jgi:hypothetical protein